MSSKANYIPLAVQLTQQRRAAAHTLEHKMVGLHPLNETTS